MKKIGKREVVLGLLRDLIDDSLQPDEFTAAEYIAIASGEGKRIKERTAARRLDSLVASGALEKRKVLIGSRITNAYRKTT